MTKEQTLPRRKRRASGFDPSEYILNFQPGELTGIIDHKCWDKGKKLITYMTFEDGRKIIAITWPRSNHECLTDKEVGSKVQVTYIPNRSGVLVIRRAVLLEEPAA